MTSQKKCASNKENSQASTGPRTALGKERARFSALKDGLYAQSLCVPGESEKAVRGRLQRLADAFNPEDDVEWALILLMARELQWIDRGIRAEKRALAKIVREEVHFNETITNDASDSPTSKGKVFLSDIDGGVLRFYNEEPCKSLENYLSRSAKRLDRLTKALQVSGERRRKRKATQPDVETEEGNEKAERLQTTMGGDTRALVSVSRSPPRA